MNVLRDVRKEKSDLEVVQNVMSQDYKTLQEAYKMENQIVTDFIEAKENGENEKKELNESKENIDNIQE